LLAQKALTTKLTNDLSLKWVSAAVIGHAFLASVVSCAVFVVCSQHITPSHEPVVSAMPHLIIGLLLGFLLVLRVMIGVMKAGEVMGLITSYNKSLRTIAVFSTYVNETLVGSTGAELEKKSVATFRYELSRLLNLANFCYTLMIKGLKMEEPPDALLPMEGAALEVKVLSSVATPANMCGKWVANLFHQQAQAGRIRAEQVSAVQVEISALMEAHAKTRAMQLAPMPSSLSSFTYCFVCAWVYTACPIIAVKELHDVEVSDNMLGTAVTFGLTFMTTMFYFGLYEAGKLMESPVKTTAELTPLDTLSFALSDDITNLADDPDQSVPVFLSPGDIAIPAK
jgi:predicted membrane chloride channel (bestrophin family)